MMEITLFSSMGFAICGLIFIILVALMYFSKKKFNSLENSIYRIIFGLTIFLLILEIVSVYVMANSDSFPILNVILTRTYLVGCIVWATLLMLYVWSMGKKNLNSDLLRKEKKKMLILIVVIDIILAIITCLLPFSYTAGPNNKLYVIGGTATSVLYVIGIILVIILMLALLNKKNNIPLNHKTPLYFSFFLFVLITAVQLFTYDFNDMTYIFTFVVVALYFTLESQDNMLLNDLKIKKDEAEKVNKVKTEFLSNMSHEIRTPLNTILGFSESLLREKELTEDIVKKDSKSIHDASVILLELINNILDISRIESGKEEKEEKEYLLEQVIFDINSLVSSKIDNKELLKFNITFEPTLPNKLYGDSVKLTKVLTSVLINAIHHTNYGQISLDISADVKDDEIYFLFKIANTGHAMKQSDFEKDFNDFVKLGVDQENNINSTTLGFIVAKRLLNILGGEISFENRKGAGTKYFIKLKQKIIDIKEIGNIFEDTVINDSNIIDLSDKRILVVDDNKINITLATRILKHFNFNISSCQSGREAIELVKDNKYDLIFLDHMMPSLDGIETLKILKDSGYSIPPVVALTANSYDGLKEKYISYGFYDYLSKPIDFKELNKLINRIFKK